MLKLIGLDQVLLNISFLAIRITMRFYLLFIICFVSILGGCKGDSRTAVLQKCQILGDESIIYARSNYVKLFHKFNPEKFKEPFNQIMNFDYVKHRNVINTYQIAVRKIKARDSVTKSLKDSALALAKFSENLVDQSYPRAIAHKSIYKPLTNNFFNEINQIVLFDHKIGTFKSKSPSFKQLIKTYQNALQKYRNTFRSDLLNNE